MAKKPAPLPVETRGRRKAAKLPGFVQKDLRAAYAYLAKYRISNAALYGLCRISDTRFYWLLRGGQPNADEVAKFQSFVKSFETAEKRFGTLVPEKVEALLKSF